MYKPKDNLKSFTVDNYHDWAIVVNQDGTEVYMIEDENWKYNGRLKLIGHLDCGKICFIEEWRVSGDIGYFYKAFDKNKNVIGFIKWADLDFYDRFINSIKYYPYMMDMIIWDPYKNDNKLC